MPLRRALYDPFQTRDDVQQARATVNEPKSPPAVPADKVAEASSPAYAIEPAWIDTAGRTRTWALKNPHGTQIAEITTKTAALKLAELLNNVMGDERGSAR